MRLKANNMVVTVLLLTAFGLDAKAQTPTAIVEAELLPEGYLAGRLQMHSGAIRWNNNR
ncbi:MAG: hypothetical protein JSW47_05485 [Phycisphaerales bacterium]|nr:MAG: hypothetical protein JSW47_05485 [Phycisphaerales bacterium]